MTGIDTPASNVPTAISELGQTPTFVNAFYGFMSGGFPSVFPQKFADTMIADGTIPMITWQPNFPNWQTQSVLTTITSGEEDAYLTTWATAAKAENRVIFVRLMHEFNGDWYPWGEVTAGTTPLAKNELKTSPQTGTYPYTNTPAMYVAAYQHIVNIFRQVGATNVTFIWCIGTGGSLTNIQQYYPGDNYIGWAAMDGYSKSTTTPKPFSQIFGPGYAAISSITSHPLMIAELASIEFSGLGSDPASKDQWITNTYLNVIPTRYPRIRAVSYFDTTTRGKTYPIDSSPSSLAAMQEVFASSLYRTHPA